MLSLALSGVPSVNPPAHFMAGGRAGRSLGIGLSKMLSLYEVTNEIIILNGYRSRYMNTTLM